MNKPLTITAAILALSFASPADAITVVDAPNDFLPSYTGPADADLDVRSFSVNFNATTSEFLLGAVFSGAINPATAGLYVIGVNTGTGPNAPFGVIGAPNVKFNQVIIVRKDSTGQVTGAAGGPLAASAITIVDNLFTVRVPLSFLPTTGFSPTQYGFNLWPRSGLGNNAQISDFAPDNATLSITAVPEPNSWLMMIAGFSIAGWSLRRRIGLRTRTRPSFA
jgi:PEP-CTERM motif